MPVIRKASSASRVALKRTTEPKSILQASSASRVVLKRTTEPKSVLSIRPVSTFEDLTDIEIPNPQDGQVLVYDSSLDKFILIDPDSLLIESVSDNDLPDPFIDQLENELNLGNISVDTLDGGGF